MALSPEISRSGIDTRPRIRRILNRRNGYVATAILAGTAVASSMAIGERVYGDPMIFPQYLYDSVTKQQCPSLDTPSFLEAAREVAEIPDHPKGIGVGGYKEYAQKQAEKYGMTLIDTFPYYKALSGATTKDEALSIMNGFLGNYGITLEVPREFDAKDSLDSLDFQMSPIDLDLINTQDFIDSTQRYLFKIDNLPVEVVEAAGVKELRLVIAEKTHTNKDGTLVKDFAGGYSGLSERIYLDIDDWMGQYNGSIVHELGHGLDHEFCGRASTSYDPEYASINPEGFHYGITIDTSGTITTSEYGSTNVKEDKAETIVPVLDIPEVLYIYDQTIKDKMTVLLARLDKLVPGALKYYVALAKRTTDSS